MKINQKMENKISETTESVVSTKMPKLSQKQKWSIVSDFIKKMDAAELVILKALNHEQSDDISLNSFDVLTVMAINTCLNRDANNAGIEDVADMLTHRINNAFALIQRLAKVVTGKQLSKLQQVLMSAAKSKAEAKTAFEKLTRK